MSVSFKRVFIASMILGITLINPLMLAAQEKARDAFLISLSVTSTLPLKYTLNNGRFSEAAYGDKVFERFAFPISIGSSIGYIYRFNAQHSLYAIWNLAYSDDPVNFISDDSLGSKQQHTATFSLQSVDQSLAIGYRWKVLPFLGIGLRVAPSLLLLRTTPSESFLDGFYNSQQYVATAEVNFHHLHTLTPVLSGWTLGFLGKGGYSDFPNYDNNTLNKGLSLLNNFSESTLETVPESSEAYIHYAVGANLKYATLFRSLDMPLITSLGYQWSQERYRNKPIQRTLESYDLNQHEVISRSTFSFVCKTGFVNRGGRAGYLFDVSLGAEYLINDSTYNQFFIENKGLVDDLPKQDQQIQIATGSENFVPILFKDYKDYTSLTAGIFTAYNATKMTRFLVSYHYVQRFYANIFARYGYQEVANRTLGAYKNERQQNRSHVFSLSMKRLQSKFFILQPFLGVQLYDSNNNEDYNLNYDLYFIGLRMHYDI